MVLCSCRTVPPDAQPAASSPLTPTSARPSDASLAPLFLTATGAWRPLASPRVGSVPGPPASRPLLPTLAASPHAATSSPPSGPPLTPWTLTRGAVSLLPRPPLSGKIEAQTVSKILQDPALARTLCLHLDACRAPGAGAWLTATPASRHARPFASLQGVFATPPPHACLGL